MIWRQTLLENLKTREALCFDLLDLKGQLSENPLRSDRDSTIQSLKTRSEENLQIVRFMMIKAADNAGKAGAEDIRATLSGKLKGDQLLGRKNIILFRLELDNMINKTKEAVREKREYFVFANNLFLFISFVVLIALCLWEGLLLIHQYRVQSAPLFKLSGRLAAFNKNIPESIQEIAEKIKKDIKFMPHSFEIGQITETLVSLCEDVTVKSKKLDELFIRDEKTTLYNYRYFKEHLIIDVERAKRFGDKVSLAMIDIDHFKQYNDANGHIAGDQVLGRLADVIVSQCRGSDVPSRFGGEEFAVLFPKTSHETASTIAERLRMVICAEPIPHEKHQPSGRLTVSIGIATFPDDAADWYTLINNADRALYHAKAAGRNMVIAFSSLDQEKKTI
ncbi:MAG: GGDEF domain-containing protein [Chlorobiaceae bacterium]|nr:GGDEF domain-containing protein [Chlorobiaceae bacterium]NTW64276.1 GGDEF domain-containing protein [Chlorobiaceae bacterium]